MRIVIAHRTAAPLLLASAFATACDTGTELGPEVAGDVSGVGGTFTLSSYVGPGNVANDPIAERTRRMRMFTGEYRDRRMEEAEALTGAARGAFDGAARPIATLTREGMVESIRATALAIEALRELSGPIFRGAKAIECVHLESARDGVAEIVLMACPAGDGGAITISGPARFERSRGGSVIRLRGAELSSPQGAHRLDLTWREGGSTATSAGREQARVTLSPLPGGPGAWSVSISALSIARGPRDALTVQVPREAATVRWAEHPGRALDFDLSLELSPGAPAGAYESLSIGGRYRDVLDDGEVTVSRLDLMFLEEDVYVGSMVFDLGNAPYRARSRASDPHGLALVGFGSQVIVNGRMEVEVPLRGERRAAAVLLQDVLLDVVALDAPAEGMLDVAWSEEAAAHSLRLYFQEDSPATGWVRAFHRESWSAVHALIGTTARGVEEGWYCLQLGAYPMVAPIDDDAPESFHCAFSPQ